MTDFYKMDHSAWDFGTTNLSLEEEAALLRIINAIHKHKGPVPDNLRALQGLFRCSPRKAKALVEALIAAGKINREGGYLVNRRALSDLAQRGFVSVSRAESGAKGGRIRAINARKALINKEPSQANASSREEKRREDIGGGGGDVRERARETAERKPIPSEPPPPSLAQRKTQEPSARLTEREETLVAMGHDPSGLSATGKFVGGQADMAEKRRWSDLGLSHGQQLALIREVMASKHDGPPVSFRYFSTAMQKLAGELARAPLQPATPVVGEPPPLRAINGAAGAFRAQQKADRLERTISAAAAGTTKVEWG